jgi:hypothetical protein
MSEILVAKETAHITYDGIPQMLVAGRTLARDTHPLVSDYPELWEPLKVQYDVEEPEPKKATSSKAPAGS